MGQESENNLAYFWLNVCHEVAVRMSTRPAALWRPDQGRRMHSVLAGGLSSFAGYWQGNSVPHHRATGVSSKHGSWLPSCGPRQTARRKPRCLFVTKSWVEHGITSLPFYWLKMSHLVQSTYNGKEKSPSFKGIFPLKEHMDIHFKTTSILHSSEPNTFPLA